jgi:hypothetical protein
MGGAARKKNERTLKAGVSFGVSRPLLFAVRSWGCFPTIASGRPRDPGGWVGTVRIAPPRWLGAYSEG